MTRHQIDPRKVSESDLARHLLAARGIQWMRGNRGDPYALILRAQGIDPRRLFPALRGAPALRQSETDVWVTVDHTVGTSILADGRLKLRDRSADRRRKRIFSIDSRTSLKHVLSVDDGVCGPERADQDRLAALAAAAIGPQAIQRRRDDVSRVFRDTVKRSGDRFDLVQDFARVAVADVLSDLLGVPEAQRDRFATALPGAGFALDAVLCPPTLGMTRTLVESFDALRSLLAELVADRSGAGSGGGVPDGTAGRDVITTVLTAGGRPDDALAAGLITAVLGAEITTNLIGAAVCALLDDPGQWRMLCDDPDRAVAVIEETLRYDPPVRIESRIAAEAVEIAGQSVPAGDQVVVLVDGANRDPGAFTEPDRFAVDRPSPAGHLSLSVGATGALVAAPARLLAEVALRTLATHAAGLRPAGEVVRRMRSPVVRGIARCPVEV
ncbi:P450-derived glycosyltransferase activator [Micromonospora sp. LOL_023]|uniref:cytochrome P450 family protein n=1 Tax=Micromonospora sp. LOL_023 TaxID=3345418 RepID=UPI003A8C01B5